MTPPEPRITVGIVNLQDETGNPYLEHLVDALAEESVETGPVRLTPSSVVRAHRDGVAALHVHWPEYLLWRRPGRLGAVRQAAAAGRLAVTVALARASRVRLVWTVHNLGPHEQGAGFMARWPYRLMGRLADGFITHSEDAERRATQRYPRMRGRTVVAPHGNYSGTYPPAAADAARSVRERFAIPSDATLLLAFGQVRAYKRLAELAALVRSLEDPAVHLLVAGKPLEQEHADRLAREAAGSERVHLDLRRIPDDDVAALYAAADLAVLHYSEVFSSGALLLSLSEGVACLTPRSAAADEVAGPPALFAYDDDEIGPAISAALRVPAHERADAARAAAARASWDIAARAHRRAFLGQGAPQG